jgi:hypothetical protein
VLQEILYVVLDGGWPGRKAGTEKSGEKSGEESGEKSGDIHDKYESRENGDFPSLRNCRSVR